MAVKLYDYILISMFLVSPVAIFFIRPDFDFSIYDLARAVFVSAYLMSVYYLCLMLTSRQSKVRRVVYMEPGLILLIVPLLFLVASVVLTADTETLRITRNFERQNRVIIFIVNLNMVLSVICAMYYFHKPRLLSLILMIVALSLSVHVAFIEGRRAIIVILFCFVGLLGVGKFDSVLVRIAFVISCLMLMIVLLVFVTDVRTDRALGSIHLVAQALMTRIFNPGWMMLHVTSDSETMFQPNVIAYILQRLEYVMGVQSSYDGVGNDFGYYYGFLHGSNYVVGINPGILVEFFLAVGIFAPLPIGVMLMFGRWIILKFGSVSKYLPLIVALLVIHGYQMEIGYTSGLMFRLVLVLGILKILMSFIPSKK